MPTAADQRSGDAEATRNLVETGMRMLSRSRRTKRVDALTVHVSALTEAQRKSDRKFERFMDCWSRQRTNGIPPKN